MEKVYYSQSILPQEFDINSPSLVYNWLVPNYTEVQKGDAIGLFTLQRYGCGKDRLFELKANTSGILEQKIMPRSTRIEEDDAVAQLTASGLDVAKLLNAMNLAQRIHTPEAKQKDDDEFYNIYTLQEYIEAFPNEFGVDVDEFTGDKVLIWMNISDPDLRHSFDTYYHLSNEMYIKFSYAEEKPFLRICYDFSNLSIRAGDVLQLLFSDRTVLSFVLGAPHQPFVKRLVKNYKETEVELSKEEIDVMRSAGLLKVRVNYKNGNPADVIDLCQKASPQLAAILFMNYVQTFCRALDECGFMWSTIDNSDISGSVSDPCYVYLMTDTTNGYHKIGISNNPKYRERTLQSEKPTIELLCAKQYPSRTIAEAIEGALHKAFGEKRLRGEWFNLSDQDVIDLKITLS
jgi:hypothetical protein